jgi:oligogalacturonide lyase
MMKRQMLVGFVALAGLAAGAYASDVGKRYPSEKVTYEDPVTHLTITRLTTSPANDAKIYQTHQQWTADGKHIVFRSNRPADGRMQAFAVNEQTGDTIQLTEGNADAGNLNVARKSNRLYYFRNTDAGQVLVELELTPLLADSAAGKLKGPEAYERVLPMPEGMRVAGGSGLDADENVMYFGLNRDPNAGRGRGAGGGGGAVAAAGAGRGAATAPASRPAGASVAQHPSALIAMDIHTGKATVAAEIPFTIGHIQGNPWVSGEVLFCHETGGDAPQRMWYATLADGTWSHKALYPETPDEWVTHECVIDKDHVSFNIMGHQPRLRAKPTGVAVINFRTNALQVYGPPTTEVQGFWHNNGSADGKWLAGDTFQGNLYLIDRLSGDTTLLTTDHKMKPDHIHPTFSPDSSRILIQSGHFSDGQSLDIMTVPVVPLHKAVEPAKPVQP